MTPEEKLAWLQLKASQGSWVNPFWRELKRWRWNQIKYRKRLGKCWVCGGRATVGHHVSPLSRGGWYGWSNVVSLDKKCHKVVHPWLRHG